MQTTLAGECRCRFQRNGTATDQNGMHSYNNLDKIGLQWGTALTLYRLQ